MECEKVRERFLKLDNGEVLPAEIAEHLANCPRCAAEAAAFHRFMDSCAAYGNITPPGDISTAVMTRIAWAAEGLLQERRDPFHERNEKNDPPLSMLNWVGTGLLIFLGMLLIPFSTILQQIIRDIPGLSIALPIALGLSIAIYAAFFTGSHIKTLSRFLRSPR